MSYRASQDRIVEAEAALKAGDVERARAQFREAARLQRAFVDALPPERVRTRSVYGLSVASLLYRAGDLDAAERLAGRLLAEDWLELHSADGLLELLLSIWADRGEPRQHCHVVDIDSWRDKERLDKKGRSPPKPKR
jgi:ATP/maltotriose-dependent transcriptional regulator MalT